MDDGKTEVLFEIDEVGGDREPLGGSSDKIKKKFSEIMGLVEQTAKSAHAGYMKIPPEVSPKELELSFGITLTTEEGLPFWKIGGEGSLQVTLRWNKD